MCPAESSEASDCNESERRSRRDAFGVRWDELSAENADLLRSLGLPGAVDVEHAGHWLVEVEGRLELQPSAELDRAGIVAAFPPERPGGHGRAHPLVRAFGRARGRILDLTTGLGADAYRLAAAGHTVTGCERSPAVYALLASGWRHACASGRVPAEIQARLDFVHGEGRALLVSSSQPERGVYLDPMYPPPRRASALPRRELQILRRLLGADDDAAGLLALARASGARVVVKRPHHAPPLGPGARHVVESKLVRFDVYLDPVPGADAHR